MTEVTIGEYFERAREYPLIDVRSPGEFADGHIPGAVNIPLFSDEERKAVGITYKQEGQQEAIKAGLEIVGPKMRRMVEQVEALGHGEITVHCWRGGMRSASVAWLLETAGFRVSVISGGYKSFRRAIIDYFSQPLPLLILGGKTGSGKTDILKCLKEQGEQIIDLEGIANHRGSAFGGMGMPPQPTTEQFQNNLFIAMRGLRHDLPIWLEDESSNIGKVGLPEGLWKQMSKAPMVMLDIPMEVRVSRLVDEYGALPKNLLEEGIERIAKKLGGQNVQAAHEALDSGQLATVAGLLLTYYDKSYRFLEQKRNQKVVAVLTPASHVPADVSRELIKIKDIKKAIIQTWNPSN